MSSKRFFITLFYFFVIMMVAITLIVPLLMQGQRSTTTTVVIALHSTPQQQPVYQPELQEELDLVEVEQAIFYQLAKEIFDSCKTRKERLRAINDLKAASKESYLELYVKKKISYEDINKLRAAAYRGRKKAEKEFGVSF